MECSCEIDIEVDEKPRCFTQKIVKARKNHICGECRSGIKTGEQYEYFSGIWDGDADTHKTCLDCLSLRNEFFRAWGFGFIWDDFCDDMDECEWQVPESCLSRVKPAARERICELIENYWEE